MCIEYDARRRLYGAALVQAMEDYATEGKAYTLTLRCGFDLDANTFWAALGYRCGRVCVLHPLYYVPGWISHALPRLPYYILAIIRAKSS